MDDLVITKVLVTKGPTLKRSVPISRGRMHPIRKRTSHITVEVGLEEKEEVKKDPETSSGVKKEEKVVKSTKKKTEPKTTKKKESTEKKITKEKE